MAYKIPGDAADGGVKAGGHFIRNTTLGLLTSAKAIKAAGR